MLPDKFFIPYADDVRMSFAKEFLVSRGYTAVDNPDNSDFVILPVPTKQYMLDEMQGRLCFHAGGICEYGFDYMKNESYVLKNAFLTAEGAVSYLELNTPYSLINSDILIIGYGRIGTALHKLLSAYGAIITVCSRSKSSEALARFNGARHIGFDELKKSSSFDVIINTVPHPVLNETELKVLKQSCIILDLASFPGGVDNHVAKSLGLTVLNGRGMPSKFTVQTAGELIGEAIIDIIEEEFN